MGAVGLYSEHLLPRLLHVSMRGWPFGAQRPRCVARAAGRVLEIGFGSGLNLPHYGPGVRELLALEPSAVARRLARGATERAPFPVRFVGLEAAAIPVDDASVDCVVSTWTLCTVPDAPAALEEIRRVLKPGGQLLFLEHGRHPDPRRARWQERLDPLQRRIAGGCHLSRPIPALVAASGLILGEVEEFELARPRLLGHSFLGAARRGT
jgi:SAM-dependent methyltransferase